MKQFILFCFLLLDLSLLKAQTPREDFPYNPHDFYTSEFNPPAGNMYRSASGAPGPSYWQNSASYMIHVTLSEKDTSISGDVSIIHE